MHKFGNIWHVTGSYSIINRNYANIGLGMSLKLAAFQFYVLTDNVLGPLIWNKYSWTEEKKDNNGIVTSIEPQSVTIPRNLKYMNFHFGMNFVFGCKPKKDFVPIID